MTNKEYKQAREAAEAAEELYTFEQEHFNGYIYYNSRYMTTEDKQDLRREYKQDKKENQAYALEDFNTRALIIPTENGSILKSYYTEVCKIENGEFFRLWEGFSVTTLKHINAYRRHFNMKALSKREWIEMEVK